VGGEGGPNNAYTSVHTCKCKNAKRKKKRKCVYLDLKR
jgi:hypothetical protein